MKSSKSKPKPPARASKLSTTTAASTPTTMTAAADTVPPLSSNLSSSNHANQPPATSQIRRQPPRPPQPQPQPQISVAEPQGSQPSETRFGGASFVQSGATDTPTTREANSGAQPHPASKSLTTAAKSATSKSTCSVDILCPAVRRMGYSANGKNTIGEGAFSRVYRARSERVRNKDIAVKIVRVDDPQIPSAWKDYSMKRELKILKRVRHPHVINIYDVIKTRTRIYIFMDLAAASVASHLEATEEPASEQTARNWFGGISNAIAYLHQIEIAHRDLKNDNILIDSNGQAKLTDFGFSCFTYDRKSRVEILSSTSCGTKAYVAPEVFSPPYNAKVADVWSLGVCLYECVTLLQPFRDDLPNHQFIKQQVERGLVIPRKFQTKLDTRLQELLRRMVEPDVNKRIRSEAVLIHPWMRMPRR